MVRAASHLLIASVLLHACAASAQETPRQLYELTTETTMPHLEENLRYATLREQRCLTRDELWSAFPVLKHAALKGCTLAPATRADDELSYDLICAGDAGATGRASWRLGSSQFTGTLYVRLGGKNMTFYQRVTARRLGECAADRDG